MLTGVSINLPRCCHQATSQSLLLHCELLLQSSTSSLISCPGNECSISNGMEGESFSETLQFTAFSKALIKLFNESSDSSSQNDLLAIPLTHRLSQVRPISCRCGEALFDDRLKFSF